MKQIPKKRLILAVLLLFLTGCAPAQPTVAIPATDPTQVTQPAATEPATEEPTEPVTEPPTLPPPEPLTVVSTATIAATGDLLMHLPVINSGRQSDGSYDYSRMFQYLAPYAATADYAVANLETTLCGASNGYAYSGYPKFNCPDGIVTSAAAAGFDMLLTANNHCNDTGTTGFDRTLRVIAENGLASLGTKATAEEPDYRIVELNGISVGLICYTYTVPIESGQPNVNGLPLTGGTADRINLFDYERLDAFYEEFRGQLAAMAEAGAEATVLFIHWGEEYQLNANRWQKTIAQELCNLGVDVIIGNHPHVVQAVEFLTSATDESHKTVCLYSTGNAVSNQRAGSVSSLDSAHTEDGVLLCVTFARYSDGTVVLEDADALPLWVHRTGSGGSREYHILPLDPDTRADWQALYGLSNSALSSAAESYDRTMAQLGSGIDDFRTYLEQRFSRFPYTDNKQA